ncbi:hypothetical protein OG589_42675 [Sphaerisporangium sp. NBC_01403]|uniref:hypothetical protein n=1 Tax=Sphaerisporangium sp. NBC_01403 TaxID=2903599 RepID=UPI003251A5C9
MCGTADGKRPPVRLVCELSFPEGRFYEKNARPLGKRTRGPWKSEYSGEPRRLSDQFQLRRESVRRRRLGRLACSIAIGGFTTLTAGTTEGTASRVPAMGTTWDSAPVDTTGTIWDSAAAGTTGTTWDSAPAGTNGTTWD